MTSPSEATGETQRMVSRQTWLWPTRRPSRRAWVRRDVVAGLVAGAVVVPQAMAYATIAGLPVEVGLYTCMLPMVVYALLGGSRTLSISTTSTIAILTATTLSTLPPGRTAQVLLRDAFTLTVLVGCCLLAMRLFRLGPLAEQVSPATMIGVKASVGITVAVTQLPVLLGLPAGSEDVGLLDTSSAVGSRWNEASGITLAVSVVAICVLLALQRLLPRAPGPLVVVAAAILLVATTDVEQRGLSLIPEVPSGLPSLTTPMWTDALALLPGALAIAVMAFLETVIVARTQRGRYEPPIDSQQELLATGAAALAGGFFSTLPPAGGFSQSVVNRRAGARSQLAGLTTAALAVLVALFLGRVLDDLPEAVLASVVLVAVIGLISPAEFVRLARVDRAELWVAIATLAAGLTLGLLVSVAVGVGLTLVLVLREVNGSQARSRRGERATPGVLVVGLAGSLYTGNARATQDDVMALTRAAAEPVSAVVLDASSVRRVTIPLLDTLEALEADLSREDAILVVAALAPDLVVVARRTSWFAGLELRRHVHPTLAAAVASLDVVGD